MSRPKSVHVSVREELERIGKTNTPLGAVATRLALRLDRGDDPGSAMAAMAKELRTTMAELTRTAGVAADPIDELRKRRERRLGG